MADAGSVYVFEYNGVDSYNEPVKLNASDAEAGDEFGNAVGISGSYIIVGAKLEDPYSVDLIGEGGSAYIFENNAGTFSQIAKLNAPDGVEGDCFGKSVGISGNDVVVGANCAQPTSSPDAGSAYLYTISP